MGTLGTTRPAAFSTELRIANQEVEATSDSHTSVPVARQPAWRSWSEEHVSIGRHPARDAGLGVHPRKEACGKRHVTLVMTAEAASMLT